MATAAAMAAHRQRREEDQQGKREQDHQADGVVDPLVVFVGGEAPELIEKVQDAAHRPIHGFRTRSCCDSFSFTRLSQAPSGKV